MLPTFHQQDPLDRLSDEELKLLKCANKMGIKNIEDVDKKYQDLKKETEIYPNSATIKE